MNVRELIEQLEKLDQELEVCEEVNGGATRTGDYLPTDGPELIEVYPVSYGGYESTEYSKPSAKDKANSRTVVVIK